MREDFIAEYGYRFRWRECGDGFEGCEHCCLESHECPDDCDRQGHYSMLSEDEWRDVRFEEFLKTHPNFGKRVFKKLDALLVEFKENFDKLNDEQKGRYLINCEYLKELFSYKSNVGEK